MKKLSRIYVAGHTGLVGSAFLRRLKKDGFENILCPSHEQLDLTDRVAVERFFSDHKPEYVVLAAGKVGGIVANQTFPADFITTNLAIELNVLQVAHKFDVQKLVFFASSCMYPRICDQPMQESALLTGLPEPTSMAYAISKLAGLQMCLAYNQQYSYKRFIPVIPNSIYGPNDDFDPRSAHVLSSLIMKLHRAKVIGAASVALWGSGAPRREFIHADDIADACLFLLHTDVSLELPLNIGSGMDISIKDLAGIIANVIDYQGRIEWDTSKPDGAPRKLLDSQRMRHLGWSPSRNFEGGLKETYRWYLQHQS
jgi:GDP-L-fucose synthase